eukprot:GFYU01011261.1.p1 GENE.GFYU01011261.1~~GFYU01011261.1.p1  ORF type:complete len:420 (-),score=76.24 GFYU01011261.1:208-1467(-)
MSSTEAPAQVPSQDVDVDGDVDVDVGKVAITDSSTTSTGNDVNSAAVPAPSAEGAADVEGEGELHEVRHAIPKPPPADKYVKSVDVGDFLSTEYDKLWDKCADLSWNDKVFQARTWVEHLLSVIQMYQDAESTTEEQKGVLSEKKTMVENHEMTKRCFERAKATDELMSLFADEEGWTLISDAKGVTNMFRESSEAGVFSGTVRLEGVVKTSIYNVLAIIGELDLYGNWLPKWGNVGLLSCSEEGRYDRVTRAAKCCLGFPWPFSKRELLLHGYGVDMLDELGEFWCTVKSVAPGDPELGGIDVTLDPKAVQMTMERSGFCFKPLTGNTTLVKMLFNVDPKMSNVPYAITNYFTKTFSTVAFDLLRKSARSVKGSIYEQRVKEDRELYGYVEEKVGSHYEKAGLEHLSDEEDEHSESTK